jgi:hypothetical protein
MRYRVLIAPRAAADIEEAYIWIAERALESAETGGLMASMRLWRRWCNFLNAVHMPQKASFSALKSGSSSMESVSDVIAFCLRLKVAQSISFTFVTARANDFRKLMKIHFRKTKALSGWETWRPAKTAIGICLGEVMDKTALSGVIIS